MGTARITIHTIPGLLDPSWAGIDVPLGPTPAEAAGDLSAFFLRENDQDDVADTVVELRDVSSALATITIPFYTGGGDVESAGPISVLITPGAPSIPAATDLFLRVVSAGAKAANLGGYYELTGAGIAPVTGSRLTTLDRVKQWGNVQGTSDDALLEALISAADSSIVQWLGYPANPTPVVSEFHSFRGGDYKLFARKPPIDATTLVVKFDGVVQDAADFAVDSEFNGECDYVKGGTTPTSWPAGVRNIELAYTSGFLVLPFALVDACNRWVLLAYRKTGAKSSALGLRTSVIGDDVATFAVEALGGMPTEVAEMVAPWKHAFTVATG